MSILLIKDMIEIDQNRKKLKVSYFEKYLQEKIEEMKVSGSLDALNKSLIQG